MDHATPLLSIIAGGLALAFVFGMIAQRLRISPLVGYLAAGVLCGPFTPGFVADASLAPELAELGIILLMFGVGLHFSLKNLLDVRTIAIPGALLQISAAIILGIGLGWLMGWSMIEGFVFGLMLSTASTVVLLRALEERQMLDSQRGQIAVGWLIVEDLAMVLTLVLLPVFANMVGKDNINPIALVQELIITLGKVVIFIALMLGVGRQLVPWLLTKSAATSSRELFTLSVLAIALGIAVGAVKIFDVSFALGAFFAGMVLNESELSQRAAHDTLPFRDAFAVLFFVSVGMLFDPMTLWQQPLAVLATVLIIVFGKSIVAYALVRLFGHSKRTALTISASLAQIGEFAFILAGLAISLNLFSEQGRSLVLAGAIISIMLNPVLFSFLDRYLAKHPDRTSLSEEEIIEEELQVPIDISDHVMLIGYGRIGKCVAPQLQKIDIPVVVVEISRADIDILYQKDIPVVFGSAINPQTLSLAGIERARALILSIPNGYEAGQIAALAREQRPNLTIIAYANFDDEMQYIKEQGADQVILGGIEIANSLITSLQAQDQFGLRLLQAGS